MASIAMYTEHPEHAVTAAQRGLRRLPGRHAMAVRLRGRAARAYACMGDRDRCDEMLTEAQDLNDRLPNDPPRRFTLDTALLAPHALAAYSTSACLSLRDFEAARRHALETIAVHRCAPHAERVPGREAMARVDLGLAFAGLGRPDEAVEQGTLALASGRRVHSLRVRVDELRAVLVARHPDLPAVNDFDEACREAARRPT